MTEKYVKPDREGALKRAYRDRQSPIQEEDAWAFGEGVRAGIDAVLDLWPGESRATAQAEALRDAADEAEAVDADALVAGCAAPVSGERGRQSVIDAARAMCEEPWTWLRARADRLEGRRGRGQR